MNNMKIFLEPAEAVYAPTIVHCYDGGDFYYGLQWFGMRTTGDTIDKQFVFPINIEPQILGDNLDEFEVLMIGPVREYLNEALKADLIQKLGNDTATILHFVDRGIHSMQRGKLRFREMAVSLDIKISDEFGLLEPQPFVSALLKILMYS